MIGAIIDTIDANGKPYEVAQFVFDKSCMANRVAEACLQCPYIQKAIVVYGSWKPQITHNTLVSSKKYFEKDQTNWEAVHSAARENGLSQIIYIPADRALIPAWVYSEAIQEWDGASHQVYGSSDQHLYFHLLTYKILTRFFQGAGQGDVSVNESRNAASYLERYSQTMEPALSAKTPSLFDLHTILTAQKAGYDITEIFEQINELNKKDN